MVPFYPNHGPEAIAVVYHLRDADAWQQAHEDRRAWGRSRCDIFALDQDHVVLLFRPGGAGEPGVSA